ncbi:PDGLE domain-containing protein [Methanosphaerula palustris]|uniref:Cobalt transport protein CbiN n=1 Tax=Methanosphaerula palustris (strain ATCC BAA-1556 / DSM 19958 / E1-9c) TaxID=521011 RepID=B8GF85_METPE|nr:PDGLE domain-containing protein [Methanosphaerula palustris]ACL17891.1 cobalt transport protein CbiN [Methanosphaerula palustris E1-9c]
MDNRTFLIAGIIVAVLIAVVAVFFASSDPDGLESTALIIQGDKTLTSTAPPTAEVKEDIPGRFTYEAPMKDYSLGESLGSASEIIAMVSGVLLSLGLVLGATKILAHPNR